MRSKYSTLETILDIITAICIFIGIVYSAFLAVWAILTLVFACVSKRIGASKGIEYGYVVGWLLGIIGLIIVCVLPDESQISKSTDKYDAIEKLQKLKESGAITEVEFEVEKSKLLK